MPAAAVARLTPTVNRQAMRASAAVCVRLQFSRSLKTRACFSHCSQEPEKGELEGAGGAARLPRSAECRMRGGAPQCTALWARSLRMRGTHTVQRPAEPRAAVTRHTRPRCCPRRTASLSDLPRRSTTQPAGVWQPCGAAEPCATARGRNVSSPLPPYSVQSSLRVSYRLRPQPMQLRTPHCAREQWRSGSKASVQPASAPQTAAATMTRR